MRYFLLAIFLMFSFSGVARADCVSPAGAESATRYDFTAHKLYYCDGTNWVEVGGAAGGGNGSGGGRVFTASGTFTVPAGVTTVKATLIGGGGGGTRVIGVTATGGGGAATIVKWLSVVPGSVMTVTVGAGGAAGTSGTPNGTHGTATQFGGLSAAPGMRGSDCDGGIASGGDININGADCNGTSGGEASVPYTNLTWGRGGAGTKAGNPGAVIIEW